MNLWQIIHQAYPELAIDAAWKDLGIELKDDGDGIDYIAKWQYEKPIPAGLKLGKD